jgi:hypothetical protein
MSADVQSILIDFITDLKENVFILPEEVSDIIKIEVFFKIMKPDDIINYIVKHVLPHETQILNRDLNYFVQSDGIFNKLSNKKIQYYASVISSERVKTEDLNIIWGYLDVLLEIAKKKKKML